MGMPTAIRRAKLFFSASPAWYWVSLSRGKPSNSSRVRERAWTLSMITASTCQMAVDLRPDFFILKSFSGLSDPVVGSGLDDAATFLINPGDHACIAIRSRMRIGAFQHDARRNSCGIPSSKIFWFRPRKETPGQNRQSKSPIPANGMAVSVAGQIGRPVRPDQPGNGLAGLREWLYGQKPVVWRRSFHSRLPSLVSLPEPR